MPQTLEDPLLLRYARSRPGDLAIALADAVPEELVEFIGSLPPEVSPPVLARLPSWQLRRLLENLEPCLLATLLQVASNDEAVAIVSHLEARRYPAILETVPAAEQGPLRAVFEYPTHTLAHLATSDFVRVVGGTSCAACCEQLANSADTRPRPVLVVDEQGRYEGIANLQAEVVAHRSG